MNILIAANDNCSDVIKQVISAFKEKSFNVDVIYNDLSMDPIELRNKYDMLVVMPFTADILAKMTVGICDSLFNALLLAWKYKEKPVVLAPSMDIETWNSPITQANIKRIQILLPNITIVPFSENLSADDIISSVTE